MSDSSKNERALRRDGQSRRDFIRWSVAAAAALGLERSRLLDVTERTAGRAIAAEMACAPSNRSVHIVAGTGGFAWYTLLWPHVDVVAGKSASAAFHAFGNVVAAQGSDRPLVMGPEAPWQTRGSSKFVTALMAGTNEAHTVRPTSSSTIATGVGLFAACAALQTTSPTLVPAIGVGMVPYGAAAGAPAMATVASADGMVGLFDSAAARTGGVLSKAKDAALFEAYYKAFLGLEAAAGRPTYARGLRVGKVGANLIGRNLADQLRPTAGDLQRYGLSGGSATKLLEVGKGLITTAKAFRLGLTSMVVLPAFNDDPHGAFADMPGLKTTVTAIGKMLDGFVDDLMSVDDPTCAGSKIGDNTVISIHGDTPKDPLVAAAWPDGTPGNSNWCYVMGAGWLKTGWFGGILRDGKVNGFDPSTGASKPGQSSAMTAMPAAAAIAYAVARGDMRRVNDFYRGVDLAGITRMKTM